MENENLASDIIKGLIKAIIALIITNILSVAGFLIYLSLPVDYVEASDKCYQEAHDNGNNSYIGGDNNVGYTDNREDNKKD
jgi:hypothetical protein